MSSKPLPPLAQGLYVKLLWRHAAQELRPIHRVVRAVAEQIAIGLVSTKLIAPGVDLASSGHGHAVECASYELSQWDVRQLRPDSMVVLISFGTKLPTGAHKACALSFLFLRRISTLAARRGGPGSTHTTTMSIVAG
eukprot:CAMPEP_0195653736 /NCGR_PEP_ID=MMETSP0815-20121206/33548_1 /TAXON_ID=97485 /ORGANISM="Prymnesium parvum, Strain Texoma1" /LENGTH=136 /DNA_ID=CAMNT_0040797905 /DNA_START=647 /DNA_END=1058 /DNA_ORIENTATION=-